MHFITSPQIRWPGEIFETHPIPQTSREFLTTIGLPEFFDWPAYEFGVYDSATPDLVIGEDFGSPIYIECSSGAVFAQGEPHPRRWFLNSSAELLSRFLYLVAAFQKTPDDPAQLRLAFDSMRTRMLQLDPPALANLSECIWAHWLDEWSIDLDDHRH